MNKEKRNEEKLLSDLSVLNQQIMQLKQTEEHRLHRELQAVEQDIQLAHERLATVLKHFLHLML